MKWITREHVKVDRVACPWLIHKFVDPAAEFYFVPTEQVMSDAQRLGPRHSTFPPWNWATTARNVPSRRF